MIIILIAIYVVGIFPSAIFATKEVAKAKEEAHPGRLGLGIGVIWPVYAAGFAIVLPLMYFYEYVVCPLADKVEKVSKV